MRAFLREGGRLVVPTSIRRAMALEPGDEVALRLAGYELLVIPVRHTLGRAQRLFRQYVPVGRSLASELVAERRAASKGD